MSNILEYIQWRGDLRLEQAEFNAVDNLILSCLSYIGFHGIVQGEHTGKPITIREAAKEFFKLPSLLRQVRVKEDEELLQAMADSARFGGMGLIGYVNEIDQGEQTQFSAITILTSGHDAYIAYRGTDNTLVGWKEDFNMSFLTPVPAQRSAVEYLQQAAAHANGKLRVGGHSKGGNLAVFAAAFCDKETQSRLKTVYNNDGPGFDAKIISSDSYSAIRDKLQTFVPQSSVVGLLLEHEENYTVIHSSQVGLMQHDPYSWDVLGSDFIRLEMVTNSSKFVDGVLKNWILEMDTVQRGQFIDILYSVLESTNAKTLSELVGGGLKNAGIILQAYSGIDDQSKQLVSKMFGLLFESAKKNLYHFMPEIPEWKIEK